MTDAQPSDKSPEQLRAALGEIRVELGDTVEELAHRWTCLPRVRAKKDDTVAGLQATKDQAAHRVQESAEKVRVVLADKVGQARTALSEKAPPTVQRVERARAVVAEKSPGLQQQVSKVVSDATPVVQQQVTKARNVLAEKAPRPATSWHPSYDPCVPYSPLSWTARISGEGAGRRRQGRLGLRELRLTEGGFAPCRER